MNRAEMGFGFKPSCDTFSFGAEAMRLTQFSRLRVTTGCLIARTNRTLLPSMTSRGGPRLGHIPDSTSWDGGIMDATSCALWASSDIQQFFRLGKSAVNELVARPDFPAPALGNERYRRWVPQQVIDWAMQESARRAQERRRGRSIGR